MTSNSQVLGHHVLELYDLEQQAARQHDSTHESSSKDPATEETKPYPWILHPVLDIALGCGGIVWLLFAVHWFLFPAAGQVAPPELMTISATGVLLFAETHTASTFAIVYRNQEVSSRYSFYTRWVAACCFGLAAIGMMDTWLTAIMVKIYLLIVPHHFMAQAFGIAMLYCMKRGYKVGKWERAAILLFVRCVTIYAMLRQLTYREWSGSSFLGIIIPFWQIVPEWVTSTAQDALLYSAILVCGFIVFRTLKSGEIFPFPAQLVLLTCVSAFVLGPQATGIYWLYVSAFFHGAQYLMVVTAQRIKESGLPEGVSPHQIARLLFRAPALKFLGLVGLISVSLYTVLPQILRLSGVEYIGAAAAIFTTVNFFHIITDGALWKLRDPQLRAQLVA
jgi:hypothetical protein